jgi:hypothetical protein
MSARKKGKSKKVKGKSAARLQNKDQEPGDKAKMRYRND